MSPFGAVNIPSNLSSSLGLVILEGVLISIFRGALLWMPET